MITVTYWCLLNNVTTLFLCVWLTQRSWFIWNLWRFEWSTQILSHWIVTTLCSTSCPRSLCYIFRWLFGNTSLFWLMLRFGRFDVIKCVNLIKWLRYCLVAINNWLSVGHFLLSLITKILHLTQVKNHISLLRLTNSILSVLKRLLSQLLLLLL